MFGLARPVRQGLQLRVHLRCELQACAGIVRIPAGL